MVDYSNKVCEACSADAPKATQSEIEDFLKNNSEWYLSTDVDFPQLKREFKFNNFFNAQQFTNVIGDLAEKEGHHPSILLEYGKVTISWWSHKSNLFMLMTLFYLQKQNKYINHNFNKI